MFCEFKYEEDLVLNRIQKMSIFLDPVKERTLASYHCCFGVIANLGMNSCYYSEKFRKYLGRHLFRKKKIKRKKIKIKKTS